MYLNVKGYVEMICPFFYAPKGYRSNMTVSFTLKEMQRYEMTGENEAAIIQLWKRKARENRSINLLEKEELNKKIEVLEPYPRRKLETNGKFYKNNFPSLLMHVYSIGCDIDSKLHYIRTIDFRGRELSCGVFEFDNTSEGFENAKDGCWLLRQKAIRNR